MASSGREVALRFRFEVWLRCVVSDVWSVRMRKDNAGHKRQFKGQVNTLLSGERGRYWFQTVPV